MPGTSKFQISRSLDERIKRIISGPTEHDLEYAQIPSAYILGFNYGNVTNCVGLTTNYQLHHAVFPVVGLAFFKTSPSDDDIKSNLKGIKGYSSSPNGLGSFKSDKNEHLFLIYSVDKDTKEVEKRIFNFTKGTFVRRKRLRLNVLNDPFTPRQIYNGTDDIFNLDDVDSLESAEDDHIDHLIFFIHGVGGVCDARFRSCVEVVADFKKMANGLLENCSNPPSGGSTPTNHHLAKHLKKGFFRKQSQESSASRSSDFTETTRSSPSRSRTRRVECLPVSWHSLTRRQTGINDQLSLIALGSVPKLRNFIDKVVLDALLYSSGPCYTQTIINNVGNEINRLYTLFMEKHPNFDGSVSLAGHSLGSVIIFDLLAHQIPQMSGGLQGGSANVSPQATNANLNNNNNIDNINNNNNIESQAHLNNISSINTRQNCRNVCHQHYNITGHKEEPQYCSDYSSLEELLKDMDLTAYSDLFHREHIDLNSLLLLTEIDMKELRLPLGARRKLGTYINFKKIPCYPLASEMQIQQQQNTQHPSSGDSEPSIDGNSRTTAININPMINMNTGQFLVEYPQLKFTPRCFFAFGSPTPMFLNIRGIQNISCEYRLPTCDRMLNIYHPYDPLAYRMEPLIDPRFKRVEPVLVPHHRGGKRIHVQLREGFARVGHDIKHRFLGSLRNTWSSFTRVNTQDVSSNPSPSDSVDELSSSGPGARKRSMKSTSSSVDVEVKSMDSDHSTGESEQNDAKSRQRKLLKRQQEINQSESILNGATIESAIKYPTVGTELGPEVDPIEAMMLDKLSSVNLDSDRIQMDQAATTTTTDKTSKKKKKPKLSSLGRSGEAEASDSKTDEGRESSENEEFDTSKIGKLNGGRRIDYVLQEKPIELFNEYIFVATSHANYWQQEDSALLILRELYQVDNIQLFDDT